jgi:hypothetical protein
MSGILAIDQGTAATGWAYCLPGCEPMWDHIRLGKRGAWEGAVFWEFRNFLLDRIGMLEPDVLAFEAPFVPFPGRSSTAKPFSLAQTRRAMGLVAHISAIAEECSIGQVEEVQTTEAVKFMTGRGRFEGETSEDRTAAKKAATVAACVARGWSVSHDEADAIAILMFTENRLYPRESLSRRMVLKQPSGPLFDPSSPFNPGQPSNDTWP